MRSRIAMFGLAVTMLAAGCLSEHTAGYCSTDLDCPSGTRCKLDSPDKNSCVPKTDAATDGPATDSHMDMKPGEVAPPCTAGTCGPASPICDSVSKTCLECTTGAECGLLNAATPACVSGKCVACAVDADCKTSSQPVCETTNNTCRACGSGVECASLSVATPVCLPAGLCVECAGSSDCSLAAKPICDTNANACKACGSGTECAAKNAATPVCASSGRCVECVANADCKMATKPVCDTTTNTCRPCQADSECPADPGVCVANIDGHCAGTSETIYVENSASCSDAVLATDASGGTNTKPLCSMAKVPAFLSGSRAVVVVRGLVDGSADPFVAAGGSSATIVGQKSATVATGANPAFVLQSGTINIRALECSSSGNVGIKATGGTLQLDGVVVDTCKGGGILLDGAAFDIRNTTVTNNGPGQQGTTTFWGGILVNALPATGPKQLTMVTIQNNKQIGLTCVGAVSGTGVLASGNAGGVDISTTCGVASCSPASPTCGAQ